MNPPLSPLFTAQNLVGSLVQLSTIHITHVAGTRSDGTVTGILRIHGQNRDHSWTMTYWKRGSKRRRTCVGNFLHRRDKNNDVKRLISYVVKKHTNW